MAEAAVAFLQEQVKQVVNGYADLISGGAENEFNQLSNELGMLKAFLKDAAMKTKKQEHMFKEIEKQIKDLVYNVEDTIDTYLTKAMNSRKPVFFNKKRSSLAKQIKSIREEKVLPMIDDARKQFGLDKMENIVKGPGGMEYPQTKLKRDKPIRQNRVVGFEDEEATITGYLKEDTEKLDIISIIGIPGQGKTTLIWKIYQNETIDNHFPIRIWVYISQKFNRKDVFLQILRNFLPSEDTANLSDDKLVQTVRGCLEKAKFLLVLDDVWSVEAWREIKKALPDGNGKGKVIITSREMDVGMHSTVSRKPKALKFLTEQESWTLLQYEVFGNLEDCPKELSGIGKQIAIKCDGVPLTIVVMGGILMDQLTRSPSTVEAKKEWEMWVAINMSDALQNDMVQRMTDVVALSYHTLPDDLRDCFVYMGIFPEDYEIPVKMLFRLWISEGFILPKDGRSLEESAEDNLNDLTRRNLLKVEKVNHMGKVKTCRVHDMIRVFCIDISKEQNLFQEIKESKRGALEPRVSEMLKFHRLCLRSDDLSKFLSENPSGPHVRSVLCFSDQPVQLEPQHISVIPDSFRKLRILESKSIKFDKFPEKVTNLIHLRYLTLYIDTLITLPESITQLWNLQSLVVETMSPSITMQANVWSMIRLRYLKTNAVLVLDSKWKGEAGQNLHTLDRLSPESCTEVVSRKAKNLKTLGISGKLANIFESKFLQKLAGLEKLKLVNSSSQNPQPNFPPNLKRLTLTNTLFSWKHMSTLAMIKSLEALKLKDNAFVGVSWKVDGYGFPKLQLLLIVNINLVLWEASTNTFPNLRFLVVKNCENLREIPEGLGTHLEKLEIERLHPSAVESARKIGETQKKKPEGKFAVQFNLKIGTM